MQISFSKISSYYFFIFPFSCIIYCFEGSTNNTNNILITIIIFILNSHSIYTLFLNYSYYKLLISKYIMYLLILLKYYINFIIINNYELTSYYLQCLLYSKLID